MTQPGDQTEEFFTAPESYEAAGSSTLPFEAAVVREAALATTLARRNNCTIAIHIGSRWGKRPVDVTITPNTTAPEAAHALTVKADG